MLLLKILLPHFCYLCNECACCNQTHMRLAGGAQLKRRSADKSGGRSHTSEGIKRSAHSITLLIWSLKCVTQHFQRTQKMKKEHIFHSLYDIPSGIVKQVAISVLQSRVRKWSIVSINAKQLLLATSSRRKSNTFSPHKDQRETVPHLLQEHHIND